MKTIEPAFLWCKNIRICPCYMKNMILKMHSPKSSFDQIVSKVEGKYYVRYIIASINLAITDT